MNTQVLERGNTIAGTITIQHIFPAKGPGRSATIKDVDGMLFSFYPDKLAGIFDVGGTYDIEFAEKNKNGTIFRDITSGRRLQPERQAAPRQQPVRPTPSPAASPAPASQGNGGGQYYRPTAPRDSERMFCCSTLNAFIQTGRIDCARDHLTAAINELRAAYAATFGQDDQN